MLDGNDNVVSLFNRPKKEKQEQQPKESFDFQSVAKRNEEKKKKIDDERKRENRGVLRSSGIKTIY